MKSYYLFLFDENEECIRFEVLGEVEMEGFTYLIAEAEDGICSVLRRELEGDYCGVGRELSARLLFAWQEAQASEREEAV